MTPTERKKMREMAKTIMPENSSRKTSPFSVTFQRELAATLAISDRLSGAKLSARFLAASTAPLLVNALPVSFAACSDIDNLLLFIMLFEGDVVAMIRAYEDLKGFQE